MTGLRRDWMVSLDSEVVKTVEEIFNFLHNKNFKEPSMFLGLEEENSVIQLEWVNEDSVISISIQTDNLFDCFSFTLGEAKGNILETYKIEEALHFLETKLKSIKVK